MYMYISCIYHTYTYISCIYHVYIIYIYIMYISCIYRHIHLLSVMLRYRFLLYVISQLHYSFGQFTSWGFSGWHPRNHALASNLHMWPTVHRVFYIRGIGRFLNLWDVFRGTTSVHLLITFYGIISETCRQNHPVSKPMWLWKIPSWRLTHAVVEVVCPNTAFGKDWDWSELI